MMILTVLLAGGLDRARGTELPGWLRACATLVYGALLAWVLGYQCVAFVITHAFVLASA